MPARGRAPDLEKKRGGLRDAFRFSRGNLKCRAEQHDKKNGGSSKDRRRVREGSSPERKRLSPIEREKNGERLVPGIEPSQRRLSPIERRTGEGVLLLDIIMNPTVVVRGGLAANAGRCEVSFILPSR